MKIGGKEGGLVFVDQKEGNGNINMGLFAQFRQEYVLTSEMVHH